MTAICAGALGAGVAACCCATTLALIMALAQALNPATKLKPYTAPLLDALGVIAVPPGVADSSRAFVVSPAAIT